MRTAKRKEQSRSAAKCRRLTESEVYVELADVLPNVDQQTVYQSDRIGLLRLASMVCRTRRLMTRLFPASTDKSRGVNKIDDDDSLIDEINVARCLDGFVIIVNKAGQLLYVSSGSSASIGFTQIDLAGKYFRDYVHNDDWHSLCQQLRVTGADKQNESGQSTTDLSNLKTFFRMKTAMTPRGGRARKLTMAVYQPMQAYIIDPSEKMKGPSFDAKSSTSDEDVRILYCTPFTLTPLQKSFSSHSSSSVACTRHEVDMRFRFCSDKLATALQHGNAKKLVGQSFYDFVYPDDLPNLVRDFRQMYKTGHTTTSYYRLSTSSGGYIWTVTEGALLVQNIRGVTQKSIVCNHYILSDNESYLTNGGDRLRQPLDTLASSSSKLIVDMERKLRVAQVKTPPQIVPSSLIQSQQLLPTTSSKIDDKQIDSRAFAAAAAAMATTSFLDPFNNYKNQRTLIGLPDDRPDLYPYISPHLMDKYTSLLALGGAAAKPFEFNSIFMAAMGATFPFAASTAPQSAKLFSASKPYSFPPMPMFPFDHRPSSIINAPTDFGHVFINPPFSTTTAALTTTAGDLSSRFQPYPSPVGILTKDLVEREDSPKADEVGRRHRLDAKTIEAFEVAMIKNELAVGNI